VNTCVLPIDVNLRKNRSELAIGDFEPKIAFYPSLQLTLSAYLHSCTLAKDSFLNRRRSRGQIEELGYLNQIFWGK